MNRPDGQHPDPDNAGRDDGGIHLESEFGRVRVRLDARGNADRLAITDLRAQKTVYLDPLELSALAWSRHADLVGHLDPARWWNEDNELEAND